MHKRLFYLDNLKTFALLLGVLFHTSIVYAPNVGYAIKSEEVNYFFTVMVHSIHVFRMPLFFFLSGFFSDMVLNKHGGKNFTFSRFERMFAPILVGLFIFAPVQYYLVYYQSHSPISFWKYYPKFLTWKEFDFSHIWFLIYLFMYSFLLITDYKFQIVAKVISNSFLIRKKKILKIQCMKIFSSNSILLFKTVIFCFAPTFLVNCFFNKDDSFFKIHPVAFTQYLTYFILGAVSYKRNFLQTIKPNIIQSPVKIFLIIVLFLFFLYISEVDPYWMNFTFESKKFFLRMCHWLLENFLAWCIIIVLLPIFKKYFDHTNSILDYLRNSGMSIYLIHHPISLLLAYIFLKIKISIFLKFTIHTFLVFLLSFFFYQYIIKKSFILKRVFGTK